MHENEWHGACLFPFHVNFFDRYNRAYLRANKVKSLKGEEDAVAEKERKLQLQNQKALGFWRRERWCKEKRGVELHTTLLWPWLAMGEVLDSCSK